MDRFRRDLVAMGETSQNHVSNLMKNVLLVIFALWTANSLWADDLTRVIQQRLKDQGFYYGEVDGQGGEETSAAIRRFQIRHGLKVTGQLDDNTLRTLDVARRSPAQPSTGYQENEGSFGDRSNDEYDAQGPRQYDLRTLPQPEGPNDYSEMQAPRFATPRVLTSFPQLFAGTIYERSPAQIQENVLYAVQGELMRGGFFRGLINGRPGPATTEAIVRLQQEAGLLVNGRLDNETLDALRAFPGQRNGPPEEGSR
jgi:peptidoglycan hydrolase-like protein with peptidoglycan-binding domain